mgnify:CR=1 FL=1
MNVIKSRLLVLLYIITFSFDCTSQTPEQLEAIDKKYSEFKDELSEVIGATYFSDSKTTKFYAQFPRSLLNSKHTDYAVGISDPFTSPIEAIQKAIKRASFIQALKGGSKTFGIIDYYKKVTNNGQRPTSMGFKEMVNVFVDSLYDVEHARIVDYEYLKSGELILTVDFAKCERIRGSAIFECYKNTKEKGKAIQKTSKIKIVSDDYEGDYDLTKHYYSYKITSGDISTNPEFADFYFSYSSYKTKFGIKGGLWAYIMTHLSETILDQATDKTTRVQSVSDYQEGNVFIELTRMVGFFEFRFRYRSFLHSLRKF